MKILTKKLLKRGAFMFLKELVKIPEEKGRINLTKKGKNCYVRYLLEAKYYPDKKYAIPKFVNIGKVADEAGMMYPNQNYIKYFGRDELSEENSSERSGCLKVGAYIVLSELAREMELKKILEKRFTPEDANLILDLAFYAIITENFQGQYYPYYAFEHPLMTDHMKIYSDSKISSFLASVETNQIQGFMNDWNCNRDHDKRIYVSYDSTNKNCQAGDIDMVEFGHAKVDKGLPIVNIAIAYDTCNEQPLFYEQYPGSIVDVSQLRYMIGKAQGYGYRNIGFILDRGYFSKPNIHDLDHADYPFIIMVKGQKSLVRSIVLENQDTFEKDRDCFIPKYRVYGKTVKRPLYASDEKDRYFHLYYSNKRNALETECFEDKIAAMKDFLDSIRGTKATISNKYSKYFNLEMHKDGTFICASEKNNVIIEELSLFGYFCIITSEPLTAKEALEIYKSRDTSEKLFRGDKSYLGADAIRVYSGESMRTKMFVEFIALILRNRMHIQLKHEEEKMKKKPNYMTVPAAIRELEKMQLIRDGQGDYIVDHATTKTQKTILKAFGIDANVLKKRNASLCKALNDV